MATPAGSPSTRPAARARRGAAGQFRDQVAVDMGRQGRVAAHGAAGVFVEHGQHLAAMLRVVEIDVDDFQHDGVPAFAPWRMALAACKRPVLFWLRRPRRTARRGQHAWQAATSAIMARLPTVCAHALKNGAQPLSSIHWMADSGAAGGCNPFNGLGHGVQGLLRHTRRGARRLGRRDPSVLPQARPQISSRRQQGKRRRGPHARRQRGL